MEVVEGDARGAGRRLVEGLQFSRRSRWTDNNQTAARTEAAGGLITSLREREARCRPSPRLRGRESARADRCVGPPAGGRCEGSSLFAPTAFIHYLLRCSLPPLRR